MPVEQQNVGVKRMRWAARVSRSVMAQPFIT